MQFIPCVERDPDTGRVADFSVGSDEYGKFLIGVFDEWKKRDISRVFVRTLDSILTYLGMGQDVLCTFGRSCHDYLVVEHNGDVYPCDFFVKEEWKLGNVMDDPLASLIESAKAKRFASEKTRYSDECASCRWLELCNGGCLKDRINVQGESVRRTYLCSGYRMFFSRAHNELVGISKRLVKTARKAARIVEVKK